MIILSDLILLLFILYSDFWIFIYRRESKLRPRHFAQTVNSELSIRADKLRERECFVQLTLRKLFSLFAAAYLLFWNPMHWKRERESEWVISLHFVLVTCDLKAHAAPCIIIIIITVGSITFIYDLRFVSSSLSLGEIWHFNLPCFCSRHSQEKYGQSHKNLDQLLTGFGFVSQRFFKEVEWIMYYVHQGSRLTQPWYK